MGKGSFILYDADLEGLDYISDVQAGKLFKAIKNYRVKNDSSFVSKNSAVNILYGQIIGHISLNEEKYKATCDKKSEAMKKRWSAREKINSTEEDSTLYSSIEKGGLLSDNDNVNENVNDNVNVNVNVNDNDNETVTDACGAKKENKRFTYNTEKESSSYEGAPISDAELMKQRVLERYKNIMNQT